jgi:hypothetical protein
VKRAYALIALGVYLASSLPYVFGYWRQTSSQRFTGIVFDVVDTAQYFAWMRSFSHSVLIANPLTPDHGSERFFNLQWWLLGLLAHHTPLGALGTYQLLRVLAIAAFSWSLAAFCKRCAPRSPVLAYSVVMLGSGVGWLLVVLKHWQPQLWRPLDVQIAEANTFFSAMAFPHLLVAAAMTLAIFTLTLRAADGGRWRDLLLIAFLTLALGLSHGYDLIPTMLVPAALVALETVRSRRIPALVRPVAAIFAGGALPALYSLSLTRLDATWSGVLKQYGNAGVYTPSPPHLLILLGLPLLFAVWQLRPAAWHSISISGRFLRVWLVVGFGLLYIPTDYQIKMLTAYQVPVGLLAVETLRGLTLPRMAWRLRPTTARAVMAVGFVATIALTNVYLTAWRVIDVRRAQYPYYLSSGDVRALKALEQVSTPGQVVLSSEQLGVFVPVYSDARPFVAHWAQTLHYFERRDESDWFFATTTTDAARADFLRQQQIDFVLAGPAEAALSGAYIPPTLQLERVLDGQTAVYRTRQVLRVSP